MFEIARQRRQDAAEIETLLDRAFGPGRHRKTSYRYRRGVAQADRLGLVARADGRLVGTIRYWPVAIGRAGMPALLLGPLAVAPGWHGQGIGAGLIRQSLGQATRAGDRLVLAVGRLDYYRRFGFVAAAGHGIYMPGEREGRLLVRVLADGALAAASGPVQPWRSVRRRRLRRPRAARPGLARPATAPAPPAAAAAGFAEPR